MSASTVDFVTGSTGLLGNYKGCQHWDELHRVNVEGTEALLGAAYMVSARR